MLHGQIGILRQVQKDVCCQSLFFWLSVARVDESTGSLDTMLHGQIGILRQVQKDVRCQSSFLFWLSASIKILESTSSLDTMLHRQIGILRQVQKDVCCLSFLFWLTAYLLSEYIRQDNVGGLDT